jgi:hypothetical protein
MTSRRREDCDSCYRRACRLIGTHWAPNGDVQNQLLQFTSMVFSVSSPTLHTDIASEMKKMGKPVAAAATAAPDYSFKPFTRERTICAVCGNPLVNGRCKFVNHKVS